MLVRKRMKLIITFGFSATLITIACIYFETKPQHKVYLRLLWNIKSRDYIFDPNEWKSGITAESFEDCKHGSHFLNYTKSLLLLNPGELVRRTIQNFTWKQSLYGAIWPKDDYTETCSRMEEQLEFLELYQKIKNATGGVKQPKVILGVGWFNLESFQEGNDIFTNNGCPSDWCLATRDIKYYKTADAVIISEYESDTMPQPPKPSNQIWILQHVESPYHSNRIDSDFLSELINWTVTYRRDSTIWMGYGVWKKEENSLPHSIKNYATNKTGAVAMMVSNCKAANDRLYIAAVLNLYIPVHVYGRCGTYTCPKGLRSSTECGEWLSKSYKFYLAFENSNCKDYITEKFLTNTLPFDILPVVYGARRQDYEAIGPPKSFIYARDFGSVKNLAEYLHLLNRNDTLYNEYFSWKNEYKQLSYDQQKPWCRLCTLLHLQSDVGYVHHYKDFSHWWNKACPGR